MTPTVKELEMGLRDLIKAALDEPARTAEETKAKARVIRDLSAALASIVSAQP